MSSEGDSRAKFKAEILANLESYQIPSSLVDVVAKALDGPALDSLFTRATAVTGSTPALALEAYKVYYGDAAKVFAERGEKGGDVVVHGSVRTVITGGIRGTDIAVGEGATVMNLNPAARSVLDDLSRITDVSEGERHLKKYNEAPDSEKRAYIERFVAWARLHASELTETGLAALAVVLGALKR